MSGEQIKVTIPDDARWKAGEEVLLKSNDLNLTLLPSNKDAEQPRVAVKLDVTFKLPDSLPDPPGNRDLVLAELLPTTVVPGGPTKALETTTVTTTVTSTLSPSKGENGAPVPTKSSGIPGARESSKPPPKDALSPGAAGGVGAVAGILFTVLVAGLCLLYFRKRRSTAFLQKSSTKPGYSDNPGLLFPTSGTSRTAADDSAIYKALEVLPQPVARSNLQRDLGELRTGIGMCVDNYLHRESIHLRDKDEQGFQALAGPRQDGRTWVSVLNDTRARPLATKALLAQCLLSMIRPKSDSNVLLLPPQLVATYKTLGTSTGGSLRRTSKTT